MNVDTIPDFLAEQRDAAPADLQHLFISFEDLWERKLWHQLTDTLIEFFNHKESAVQRLPFYRTFILTFADKINQLKLVTLALSAATQCKGWFISPGIYIVANLNRQPRTPDFPNCSGKQGQQPQLPGCIRLCYGSSGHSQARAEGYRGRAKRPR